MRAYYKTLNPECTRKGLKFSYLLRVRPPAKNGRYVAEQVGKYIIRNIYINVRVNNTLYIYSTDL